MHFLDLFLGMAARSPRFFEDGWGDRSLCASADPESVTCRRIKVIDVRLSAPQRAFGGLLYDGSFQSPEERLPHCARTAQLKMLLPQGEIRGMVLQLAASGDQGFRMRLRFAEPLLAAGIGSVVLENAFYGARRPAGQVAHAIRSVSDLHLMASATLQEGRALLRWLKRDRGHAHVGVTGFSMGGQMAAMVGASMPFPVAVVPVAASCSPDSVLRDGILKHTALWTRLRGDGETDEVAKAALLDRLSQFSVTRLPAPVLPAAAIVVGTAADGVVPPEEMRRIAEYWGAELRWLPAGHVTAVLRHQGAMRQAIVDAFERLAAARSHLSPTRRRRAAEPVRAILSLAARAPAARGAAALRNGRAAQPIAGNRR